LSSGLQSYLTPVAGSYQSSELKLAKKEKIVLFHIEREKFLGCNDFDSSKFFQSKQMFVAAYDQVGSSVDGQDKEFIIGGIFNNYPKDCGSLDRFNEGYELLLDNGLDIFFGQFEFRVG
jgi:hypothetical protein